MTSRPAVEEGSMRIRALTGALLGAACAAGIATAYAQGARDAYPIKPIRLISPFAPGGGATLVARMIAPDLGEALGHSIIIDNRPGGGGVVGTEIAARAPADGYTLLMATASNVVINPLVAKAPYDPLKDFTAIAHTSTVPLVLVVHPSVPAKSVREFVEFARSPG